jgi:hypothetical protein
LLDFFDFFLIFENTNNKQNVHTNAHTWNTTQRKKKEFWLWGWKKAPRKNIGNFYPNPTNNPNPSSKTLRHTHLCSLCVSAVCTLYCVLWLVCNSTINSVETNSNQHRHLPSVRGQHVNLNCFTFYLIQFNVSHFNWSELCRFCV